MTARERFVLRTGVSELVGALSPANHKGLRTGLPYGRYRGLKSASVPAPERCWYMSNSWKAICRDRLTFWNYTKLKCYRIRTYRKKSMTVQFNFSDTSMTNNVKVIKRGVWTDQAQQDWCDSLFMHALTDVIQKMCKKKQGQPLTHANKRRVLVETENGSVVSLGYVWPNVGAKAHRPAISPHDRSRNSYKSPPTILKSLLCRHSCLLHPGIPLIISSHTSSWVCISV